MTILTANELETIRQQPKISELHLSIFQPRTIMKCLVNNGSIADGARTIAYDNVSSGSYASVEAGMTLLIGSTDGADDIGRVRIRSVTVSQFVVAENSIAWADNLYLTVLRYWEVWPVYPRIISDPADAENVIFYKDYDIAYTDQNEKYGAFACAGPHRAAFIDESTGVARVYWSAEDTDPIKGTISSYEWAFEGGSPTGSTSASPGFVDYSTPGHYVTRLKVTTSLGVVDTTYRYVSIYDKPGHGSSIPPQKWVLQSLDGSRAEGGYTLALRLYENVGIINDGAVVVLYGDDWYGDTQASLGGDSLGNSGVFFVGYVLKDSIHYNYDYSYVEFHVGSITEQMKICEGFSVSVEDKVSPTTWFQLQDMTIDRAIYHYLKWHSTVLSVSDFIYTGNGSQKLQYFDSDRGSLFDAIDNFLRSAVVGQITSNRQGRIYGEVNAEAVHNATGTFAPIMILDKRDWMSEPVINENLSNQVSYLEMGGIAYYGGVSGSFSALLACAPGEAPHYRGKAQRLSGLVLDSQTQLNNLVGDVVANRNAKYPSIDVPLAGSYKNLDIAPQEAIQAVILPDDTARNVSINAPYIPTNISYTYDHEYGMLVARATVGAVTSGRAGKTIEIPVIPDDGGFGNPNPGSPAIVAFPPIAFSFPSGTHAFTFGRFGWSFSVDGPATFIPASYFEDWLVDFDFPNGNWQFNQNINLEGGTFGPGLDIFTTGFYRIAVRGTVNCTAAITFRIIALHNNDFNYEIQYTDDFDASGYFQLYDQSIVFLQAGDTISVGGWCVDFLAGGNTVDGGGTLEIEFVRGLND